MKFKYLTLIIIILAISTSCAVSASTDCDNITMTKDTIAAPDDCSNITMSEDAIAAPDDCDSITMTDDELVSEADRNLQYFLDHPWSVLADSDSKIRFGVYSSSPGANGNLSLYIDDSDTPIYSQPVRYYKESDEIMIDGNFINFKDYKLNYGNHTALLKYSGDETYMPFEESWKFDYDYLFCRVPHEIYTSYRGEQSMNIEITYPATGNFRILVDDREVFTAELPSSKFENFAPRSSYLSYPLTDLSFGEHNYTIIYSNGNYPGKRVSGKFNVTYDIIFNLENSSYDIYCGKVNNLILTRPPDGTGNFIVKFENRTYEAKVDEKTNQAIFTIENFTELGTLPISVTYQDSKYPLKEFTEYFFFKETFYIPDDFRYGDHENITLILPQNATGDLIVYINEELIQKIPLVNGRADYQIPDRVGFFKFRAVYNGTYAEIRERFGHFGVIPKTEPTSYLNVDEDYELTVTVNDDANNTMIIKICDNDRTEKIIYNGTQKSIHFTKEELGLKSGAHHVYAAIVENNTTAPHEFYLKMFDIRSSSRQFQINAKGYDINLYSMTQENFNTGSSEIMISNVPSNGDGTISAYVNGKLVATENHFTTLIMFNNKLLKKGDNKCTVTYTGDSYYANSSTTFTINVYGDFKTEGSKKADTVKLTLKKVSVKKSAKKLVLRATLKINGKAVKGKVIKFKFKGKTYKAKTNAKGIAKVTIKKKVLKKLKAGKKVTYSAKYSTKTVKKTVKVKK